MIALRSEGESTKIKQKGQTNLHVAGEAQTDKGTRDTDGQRDRKRERGVERQSQQKAQSEPARQLLTSIVC